MGPDDERHDGIMLWVDRKGHRQNIRQRGLEMNELAGSNQLVPSRHGTYKRVRAAICKHCPACKQARKNPASIVGKFLHHPWHSTQQTRSSYHVLKE